MCSCVPCVPKTFQNFSKLFKTFQNFPKLSKTFQNFKNSKGCCLCLFVMSAAVAGGGSKTVPNVKATTPVPADTVMSLMIPWVQSWQTEADVKATLGRLGWGTISQVDMKDLSERDGKPRHYKVFIHFSSWGESETAVKVRGHLEKVVGEGEKQPELKVWYSDRNFWKVRASKWVFKAKMDVAHDVAAVVEFC